MKTIVEMQIQLKKPSIRSVHGIRIWVIVALLRQKVAEELGFPCYNNADLTADRDDFTAAFVNGDERIPVTRVEWDGRQLLLEMSHYDSRITAPG